MGCGNCQAEKRNLGKYSGRFIFDRSFSTFEFERINSNLFDISNSFINKGDLMIPISLGKNEQEEDVYQVGDCAVKLEFTSDYIVLRVYNKNPEKRQATIKSLDEILK